jgi:hypothetical protein
MIVAGIAGDEVIDVLNEYLGIERIEYIRPGKMSWDSA